MGHQDRMKRIEEHFRTASVHEVEQGLIRAGIEHIAPANQVNMVMLTEAVLESDYRYSSAKMSGYRIGESHYDK